MRSCPVGGFRPPLSSQLKLKPNDACAGEPDARRQMSAAAARTRGQHHSEDAGSGQKDRSPEVARCASLHSLPRRRNVRMRESPTRISGD